MMATKQWRVDYDNDVGDDDDGFWEWWEVTNGATTYKADKEAEATLLCDLLNGQDLSAPRVPEGWRIRRDGEVIVVTKRSLGGYAAGEEGRSGIAESILYHLCNDLLTTATPEQKEIE